MMNLAPKSPYPPYQLRLVGTLLTPSTLSFSMTLVASLLLIGIPSWSFIEGNQTLFELFYGQYGLVSALEGSADGRGFFSAALASLPFGYNVAVFVFSLVVAGSIFAVLQIVNRVTSDVATPLIAIRKASPWYKKTVAKEEEMKFALRAVVFLLWFIHFFFTVKVVWPFSILAARTTVDNPGANWQYALLGVAIMALTLHLHVILLRLVALRPRLTTNPDTVYKK